MRGHQPEPCTPMPGSWPASAGEHDWQEGEGAHCDGCSQPHPVLYCPKCAETVDLIWDDDPRRVAQAMTERAIAKYGPALDALKEYE